MSPVDRLPDNDTYFMGIAFAVRGRANCTGNRVGAVIVRHDRVISTGYNGVPSGMKNCLEGGCLRCQNPGRRFPSGTGYDLCILCSRRAKYDAECCAIWNSGRGGDHLQHDAAVFWLCQGTTSSKD